MRRALACTLAMALLVPAALATPTRSNGSPDKLVGDWHGRSLCVTTTRPACTDETVLAHVRKDAKGDGFSVELDKIVGGQAQSMGAPLPCRFEATRQQLICRNGSGEWRLRWDGDMLVGGLIDDKEGIFRFVQVSRAPSR